MKDDLEKFIKRRKRTDAKFAENFESGYQEFKVGVLLRQAREEAGITQEDLAQRTKTKKSAISRLENQAKQLFFCKFILHLSWLGGFSSSW